MKNYIGIDLGGTNIRVSKVSEQGQVIQEIKGVSYGLEGPEKVITNMVDMIKQIDDYQSCSGIGIGVPGPVDTINGVMKMSTNLPGFTDYPVGQEIYKRVGLPTYLDNDANVAGLAEALVGAGKNYPIVYYVTISTGIGGALIVNGKVVSGKNGYAGEIGNIIVKDTDQKYNQLNAGAVECEASGTAMTFKAKKIFGEDIKDAKDFFDKVIENDKQALLLRDQMAKDLARLFASIAHVVDPNVFVIGGGVMKSEELFMEQMKNYYLEMVHPGMGEVVFTKAMLDEPGIIGAAMLPRMWGI